MSNALPRKSKGVSTWIVRILITLAVLALLGLVGLVMVSTYGRVSGTEFSPDTFRVRQFSYNEIPGLGIQINKVKYSAVPSLLVNDLTKANLIPPPPPGPVTWHQVTRMRGSRVIWQGDPSILLNYLGIDSYYLNQPSMFMLMAGEEDSEWLEFNENEPELSAILWPEIVELARQELYMYVPEVFELARGTQRPARFQSDLNEYLTETYTFVGTTRSELGEYQAAIEAFDAALARTPEHEPALLGRKKAQEAAETAAPPAAETP